MEPEVASDVVRAVCAELDQRPGRVGHFYNTLGHKPEILWAFVDLHKAI